jgi:hypothetical protein
LPNLDVSTMSTASFYSDLPELNQFLAITNPSHYQPVPRDWYVVITDIVNSTQQVAAGKYREVNFLGASSIIVILNLTSDHELPFIFGGDGASVLIPPALYKPAQLSLLALQQIAEAEFRMRLRVAMIPVADLMDANQTVAVAKVRISDHYTQAAIIGGGLTYATDLAKHPDQRYSYSYKNYLDELSPETANFSGLECRWQDIPSHHGEAVSLIAMATSSDWQTNGQTYSQLIQEIYRIYGDDCQLNPVSPDKLRLSFSYQKLITETKVRTKSARWWHRWLYLAMIWLGNLIGTILMRYGIATGEVDWGKYKAIVIGATDYRKLDDILKMVISGTSTQRQLLEKFLESQYRQGKLVYGIHVSDRVLMTCLVLGRNGQHVHFIDGADGGYTLAASAMKARLAHLVKT